jgi:hypothetical protein
MGRAVTIRDVAQKNCPREVLDRAFVIRQVHRYLTPATTSRSVKPNSLGTDRPAETRKARYVPDAEALAVANQNGQGKRSLTKWSAWRDVLLAWLLALMAVATTIFIPIEEPTHAPASGKFARVQHMMPIPVSGPRDESCSERDFVQERC